MEPIINAAHMRLGESHREQLLASGISDDVISERGYWSAGKGTHDALLRALGLGSFVNRLPGLIVPICGVDGEQESAQLRLDIAEVGMRYKSPTKAERPITMDIHPRNVAQIKDASVDLWITEGVKKADAATSHGLCCVALMGVTMWTKKDDKGNVTALPEWDAIELRERNVYVAFDSDVTTKAPVQKALAKLKTFLEGRGAFVHTVYLPDAENGEKVGLDDYLAAGHSVDDLYQLPQYKAQGDVENPKLLAQLNAQLAVLEEPAGVILYENDKGFQLRSPGELNTLFANVKGAGNESVISWWLRQSGRRQLGKVVFRPGQQVEGDYNLWKGWALEPIQKDITPFWDFVREVICAKDDERYKYLRKWMAHAVQRPAEMPRVALLLHSVEGTGKGMFMDWFKQLFGDHYFEVTSLENAIGHFNAHLGRSLLVFANEAVWGGDKRQQGRMKALITDATSDVTSKGKDTVMIDNYKRWVFASNADNPVPIDRSDRRFVVFEVSTARKGQSDYYKALENLRDREGGVAGLMYDLLHEDITGFNPAAERPTSGLARYKQMTASPFDQWLQGCLTEGEIRKDFKGHDCYEPWIGLVAKNTVFDAYQATCRGLRGDRLSVNSFWDKMREVGAVLAKPSKAKVADASGNRTRAAELVPLADARTAFAAYMSEDANTLWEHAAELPGPCEHPSHDVEPDAVGF